MASGLVAQPGAWKAQRGGVDHSHIDRQHKQSYTIVTALSRAEGGQRAALGHQELISGTCTLRGECTAHDLALWSWLLGLAPVGEGMDVPYLKAGILAEVLGVPVPGPSDCSSAGARVQSRLVQRLFSCGTGFLRSFPFHAVSDPVAKVNHKTCRSFHNEM